MRSSKLRISPTNSLTVCLNHCFPNSLIHLLTNSLPPLRFPSSLVQLLVRFQGESKVVRLGVRDGLIGVDNLADNVEIVPLGFVVDDAVAREGPDDVVIDTGGLLAGDAGEFEHRRDGAFFILAQVTQSLDRRAHEAANHLGVFLD